MTYRAQLNVQVVGATIFEVPLAEGFERFSGPDTLEFIPEGWHKRRHDDVYADEAISKSGRDLIEFAGRVCYGSFDKPNPKTASNKGYIENVLKQAHWSVAEHSSVSFYFTGISRSLSHELVRHRHFSVSQLSQRFVSEKNIKVVLPPALEEAYGQDPEKLEGFAEAEAVHAIQKYKVIADFIKEKHGDNEMSRKQIREAARFILPNGTETKMVVTGNYRSWAEFLVKRDNPAADAEIQRLAREVGRQLADIAPNVFGEDARALWDDSAAQGESSR